jgi:hypothetical protein
MRQLIMRKAVKRAVGLGLVAAAVYAAWRAWRARSRVRDAPNRGLQWEAAPFPFPPVPRPPQPVVAQPEALTPWVTPNGDGVCPASHPVKAKLTSGIFHVPGRRDYQRTKPDRCYRDAEAAEADGLRASKI